MNRNVVLYAVLAVINVASYSHSRTTIAGIMIPLMITLTWLSWRKND